MTDLTGIGCGIGNLFRLRDMRSRAIDAENPTGEPGMGCREAPDGKSAARELGVGWKVRPCREIGGGVSPDAARSIVKRNMWFVVP